MAEHKQSLPVEVSVSSEVNPISSDPRYVQSTRLYGVGIKQDPIVGSKCGKGRQDMISPIWIGDLGKYMHEHQVELREILEHAQAARPSAFVYLMNHANSQLIEALKGQLNTPQSRQLFLASSWTVMAAIEVDDFPYAKFSKDERTQKREEFYRKYAAIPATTATLPLVAVDQKQPPCRNSASIPTIRMDLLPHMAIERLAIHCELCALKYADPTQWESAGFSVRSRIASLKRHLDYVLSNATDEDHIAHLLWNYMAVYQVLHTHPSANDLVRKVSIYTLLPGLPKKPWKLIDLQEEFLQRKAAAALDMHVLVSQDTLLRLASDDETVYTYGGFGEERTLLWEGFEKDAAHMVHLGVDFNNLPPGQAVAALESGSVVYVYADPTKFNGWGGRVIVRSTTGDRYVLYGHLQHSGLPRLGAKVVVGDVLGKIAANTENGGWFSHLHLQIMSDAYVQQFKTLAEIDGYDFSRAVQEIVGIVDPLAVIAVE